MLALAINHNPILAHAISQPRVHAVDAILHGRIHARHAEALEIKSVGMAPKEFLHDLPIRTRGRSFALLAGGVAMTLIRIRVPHFSVRLRSSSQAATVLESGKIISSRT